jgi:hypothetical protein
MPEPIFETIVLIKVTIIRNYIGVFGINVAHNANYPPGGGSVTAHHQPNPGPANCPSEDK